MIERATQRRRDSSLAAAGMLLGGLLFAAVSIAEIPAWEAKHPRLPGTILLLGSIHLLRAEDHPLPHVVDEVYARADNIVFEIDLDDISGSDVQSRFMGAAMLPGGASLKDVLEPSLYLDTEQLAARFGVDVRLLSRFEPWFVATMLMSFGLGELGYDPRFGIEQYLLSRAREDGKEVSGLESLDTQVAVFDLLSDGDQAAFLEQTIAELEADDEAMAQLVDAWRAGALELLQADLMADFAEFPGLYERLVADRNAAWVDTLETFFARPETSAVVVGALHLVGDDSVVELLLEQGYLVTALP